MRAKALILLAVGLLLVASSPPADGASVSITGPEQIVYDWSTMACSTQDWPDGVARAFRDADGQVQLIRASSTNRRQIGPNLNQLTNDCTILRGSNHDPFPSHFDDTHWLGAAYTVNGTDVFALFHSEYHGSEHPGWCPSGVFFSCRYNSATFAKSTNGGDSYVAPPSPTQSVATIPYPYDPDAGRYGVFSPSNIIEKGGYYYSMLLISDPYKTQRSGACLMRTKDLADPASWRAWDGAGFTVRFIDPYTEPSATPGTHTCQPVSKDEIGPIERSLTYNTYLNKYFVIGTDLKYDAASQQDVRGFYYSFSDDLIHWSNSQLLVATPQCVTGGTPGGGAYPAILDPNSTDRNFNTVGQNAYMYFVRSNRPPGVCGNTDDRDYLRVPIQFSP
jgi:hypothetical protein